MAHYDMRQTGKDRYDPHHVDHSLMERVLAYKGTEILDANIFVDHNEFAGRKTPKINGHEQSTLDALVQDNNVITTGAAVSEAISVLQPYVDIDATFGKLAHEGVRARKINNLFERRLGDGACPPRGIQGVRGKNILDVIQGIYGIPQSLTDADLDVFYHKAAEEFKTASSEEELRDSKLAYFLAASLDVARNIETTGKKNPHNILFDAYALSFGLTIASEAIEKGIKGYNVLIDGDDGDLEKIYEPLYEGEFSRAAMDGMSESEEELQYALDRATLLIKGFEPKLKCFKRWRSTAAKR